MHDVACEAVRSKDAQKQLARMSLTLVPALHDGTIPLSGFLVAIL